MRSVLLLILLCSNLSLFGQSVASQSIARKWNEALLSAIRIDKARPPIHARNLFHVSVAMYDAWATYDNVASTYLIPKPIVPKPTDITLARNEAISYAAFRLISYRFSNSPGKIKTKANLKSLFVQLGYDSAYTSTDYSSGSPAALGNFIAAQLIEFGLQDGSNEIHDYANKFYQPVNPPLIPINPGDTNMKDCNRWQPLTISLFCDQSCNCSGSPPAFIAAEWGGVSPFALQQKDLTTFQKNGNEYLVYHDPGPPPLLDSVNGSGLSNEFEWNFSLVSAWSSHLDQRDSVMIDISPNSIGNLAPSDYPTTLAGLRNFYNLQNGGDISMGYKVNPITGLAYKPQLVFRGDYTRVLAEFWADGPNSETPPGHWFVILNKVSDSLSVKKLGGTGSALDGLEWDVKAYLTLGGAVHDAAISCWGIKGYYDGVRPISAIRYMAGKGQSTSPTLPRYHPAGIPLLDGFIELVQPGDPLAGTNNENVNKIKVKSWKGSYIDTAGFCTKIPNPHIKQFGVGWVLADNWVPYQRPSFVTPPFAGYTSGHSTYSSAGAEVLTLLTGSEYFPKGVGEFYAKKDSFLVFEKGPSMDVTLQWARYKDAADQCSLSRIWGGIHPPSDDMPGRLIGQKIGTDAFTKALGIFGGITAISEESAKGIFHVYPNPVAQNGVLKIDLGKQTNFSYELFDMMGRIQQNGFYESSLSGITLSSVPSGMYILKVSTLGANYFNKIIVHGSN